MCEHADSDAEVACGCRPLSIPTGDPAAVDAASRRAWATPSSATDAASLSTKTNDEDDVLARMSAAARTLLEVSRM
jgi:hypothetical protein